MSEEKNYAIENYAGGCIVADYSGKRGQFGAAYAGKDGIWRDQPMGMEPFNDESMAESFAKSECS